MDGVRVAVVGAGIAGLAVAAWLDRAGIACTVYERSRHLGEVGAGIQIGPNASRLLHRLGLADDLRAVGVRPEAVLMRHWRTGKAAARMVLGDFGEAAYGAPYYALHRADLHRALRRRFDRVEPGRRCVGAVDHGEGAELVFDDGTRARADLVVGADGIRSAVRDAVARDAPVYSGLTVYRGLAHRIRVDRMVTIWLGPGRHCVWYPISGGRVNVVASVPEPSDSERAQSNTVPEPASPGLTSRATKERARREGAAPQAPGPARAERAQSNTEDWTAPGRVADVLAAYEGWHPDVRRVLSCLDSVTRWALHERPALDRLCTDRVVLVGDAAHPMLPFGAQGASQAIEDAAVLAACLRGAGPGDVPAALRRYEEVRRPRLARVGAAVGVHRRELHLADGPEQRERDRTLAARLSVDGQRWLYGYDAEAAAPVLVSSTKPGSARLAPRRDPAMASTGDGGR